MPSPIPKRDKEVFFVGAGLSSAFDLPNTPALISEVMSFSRSGTGQWLGDEHLISRLNRAFRFFYPDAEYVGFQPDVVDFFSSLRTYLDVGAGLVGTGFKDAPELYRLLRRGIAHLLIERTRQLDQGSFKGHRFLKRMVEPGNVIITSNWDCLVEHFARINSIPLRLTSRTRELPENEVTLIKLHGSIDWCQLSDSNGAYPDESFATLKELRNAARLRRHGLPTADDELVRIRTPQGRAWQRVRTRASQPYIVTMATGKADDLGPLREVWRDAYRALSRAARLEIVGYSMPSDDVEIRTILRTGLQRGNTRPAVMVRNPAPDVHYRIRNFLDRTARSRYIPVPGIV